MAGDRKFVPNILFMSYWLVKSEPFVYPWERLVKEKKVCWDGVRNYAARLHLRAMKKGDSVFFYHSNEGMAIVGIARVKKEAYPDPTDPTETWSAVDLEPVKTLKLPVSLASIKSEKRLASMAFVKQSRLSVSPVTDKEWAVILEMAGMKS